MYVWSEKVFCKRNGNSENKWTEALELKNSKYKKKPLMGLTPYLNTTKQRISELKYSSIEIIQMGLEGGGKWLRKGKR